MKTYVERGSIVKKGDLLVQLDPRDAQYALDEGQNAAEELRVRLGLDESKEFHVDNVPEVEAAKLAMQLAEQNYRRAESLKKQNAIALSDADQLETDYRSAVAAAPPGAATGEAVVPQLSLGRDAPGDAAEGAGRLLDPGAFDGWVAERNISVGERVIATFPGAKLVTLLRIDPLRLSLTVPQQEMAQIKVGQTVTFQTDAFPGKTFTGTVRVHHAGGDQRQPFAVRRGDGAQSRRRAAAGAVRHRGVATGQAADRAVRAPGGGPQPRRRGRRVRGPRRRRSASRSSRWARRRRAASASPRDWRRATSSSPRRSKVHDGDSESDGLRLLELRRRRVTMNFLASICIRRPVFATVLTLVLLVFGVVGYLNLGLDRFPKIDFPIITVTTRLPGSASEEVETEITDKIEEAVNTTSGIDELRSVSSEGISQVFITFVLEKDADIAAQEVRDKVNRILPDLPKDIEQPFVEKFDPDSMPVMTIAVSAPASIRDLTEYCDKVLRRQLESLPGVGQVMIVGGQKRQINVQLDGLKLRSHRLTVADVAQALQSQNLQVPGGTVKAGQREYTLRTMGRVDSVAEIEQITVANVGGHTITIGDLGHVEDGAEEIKSLARYQRHPGRAAEHPQAVGHEHRRGGPAAQGAAGATCRRSPPRTTRSRSSATSRRSSRRRSIRSRSTWCWAALLAAVVIFFFLANLRTTVISALAIPTSIISAFAVVYLHGLHAQQHHAPGAGPVGGHRDRRRDRGAGEHLPLHRGEGLHALRGRLRRHQGDRPGGALDHALAGGGVPAHRLHGRDRGAVPQVVRHHHVGHDPGEHDHQLLAHADAGRPLAEAEAAEGGRRTATASRRRSEQMARTGERRRRRIASPAAPRGPARAASSRGGIYPGSRAATWRSLRFSLRQRWVVVLCVVGMLALVPMLMGHVRKNFLPDDDQSEFEVKVRAPEGTSLEATFVILDRISRDVRRLSGVEYTLTSVADNDQRIANEGTVYVRMVPLARRRFDQFEMMNYVRENILPPYRQAGPADQRHPGGRLLRRRHVAGRRAVHDRRPRHEALGPVCAEGDERPPPGARRRGRRFVAGGGQAAVRRQGRTAPRPPTWACRSPTWPTRCGCWWPATRPATTTRRASSTRSTCGRLPEFRNRLKELATVSVPSSKHGIVALGDVVKFEEGTGPAEINRLNRNRQVTISGNMTPGTSQQTILDAIDDSVAAARHGPRLHDRPVGQIQGNGPHLPQLPPRLRQRHRLRLPGHRRAVRVVAAPDHDPALAAADAAVRPDFADHLRAVAEHLLAVGHPGAVRRGEEELDLADRPHQPAPRGRAAARAKRSWRPTATGSARSS